jgi:deferrochelatase/peroxidase EfeB
MSADFLAPPLPRYEGPYQTGISDPVWPALVPANADPDVYARQYAGQIERQRHLHVVFANVSATSRTSLFELLKNLTQFSVRQMKKAPPPMRPLDTPPTSRRVSVTIGFGANLFTTVQGDDRFDLAGLRPRSMKIMPSLDGDEGFMPADQATDLAILIASDDYYVDEYIFGRIYYGGVHPDLIVKRVERGYARPDSREPSGFEDGITNPKNLPTDPHLDDLVFVHEGDQEPEWCVAGTYLAYRKIRRRLSGFFKMPREEREAVFGVDMETGLRYPSPPASSHGPKMNPRRKDGDFTGTLDDSRRFLRRPYFFNDGLDATGDELRGVHHISFVRDLAKQYEWPILMWQTNKDFPFPGAGGDALYERGGAANIGGGYFFVPAAPKQAGEFIGSGLFL